MNITQSNTAGTGKWVRDLVYERFCLHWTKLPKTVLLMDKTVKLYDKCHRQSHQSNGAAEKEVSTVRGLARTYLTVIREKIASFDEEPDSPMLPWPITRAACALTRYLRAQ